MRKVWQVEMNGRIILLSGIAFTAQIWNFNRDALFYSQSAFLGAVSFSRHIWADYCFRSKAQHFMDKLQLRLNVYEIYAREPKEFLI